MLLLYDKTDIFLLGNPWLAIFCLIKSLVHYFFVFLQSKRVVRQQTYADCRI